MTDANGALVPDAAVTLTSNHTNISHRTKKILNDVRVEAEQARSLNIELEVGLVTQSVTVSEASVPHLDTEAASIGGTLTSRDIENLPSIGRDPLQLIRLTPGVFGDGAQSFSGGTTTLPGSNRPSANPRIVSSFWKTHRRLPPMALARIRTSFNSRAWGLSSVTRGGSAVLTPNEESIKEVRVIASDYSAENGRNSGAQILIISKNGTNDLHGSAFFK